MLRRPGGVSRRWWVMSNDSHLAEQERTEVSPLTQAMIINGAVLFATLECDLGPHRKIGAFRILRTPVVLAAVIPLFLDRPVTHGTDAQMAQFCLRG